MKSVQCYQFFFSFFDGSKWNATLSCLNQDTNVEQRTQSKAQYTQGRTIDYFIPKYNAKIDSRRWINIPTHFIRGKMYFCSFGCCHVLLPLPSLFLVKNITNEITIGKKRTTLNFQKYVLMLYSRIGTIITNGNLYILSIDRPTTSHGNTSKQSPYLQSKLERDIKVDLKDMLF